MYSHCMHIHIHSALSIASRKQEKLLFLTKRMLRRRNRKREVTQFIIWKARTPLEFVHGVCIQLNQHLMQSWDIIKLRDAYTHIQSRGGKAFFPSFLSLSIEKAVANTPKKSHTSRILFSSVFYKVSMRAKKVLMCMKRKKFKCILYVWLCRK